MSVPKALREKYLAQLERLIAESQEVLDTRATGRDDPGRWFADTGRGRSRKCETVDADKMVAWRTRCVTVLSIILPESHPNRTLIAEFQKSGLPRPHTVTHLRAHLSAVRDDFRDGFLDEPWNTIQAQVSTDFLDQAEQLLQDGYHLPAAVVAGAVLERSLRGLCEDQKPPIPTALPNGKPKTLSAFIEDLKAAGLYNETQAKHLRAWAGIRNHAAHGEPDKFNPEQVDGMLRGIIDFLPRYCG